MSLHIISVGGSLIVPQEKPNAAFLASLRDLLTGFVQRGDRFVLVTGGGKTARVYIDAAKGVTDLVNDDLDWLGIHATRLNGHLLRTIFRDVAHPIVIKHPLATPLVENWKGSVLVAAGWKPGRSTDYVACRIAKRLGEKTVINLSNIAKVYTGDPKKDPSAKPRDEMGWKEYRKMVGNTWSPGLSAPFDPVASRFCEKHGMRAVVMSGMRMEPLLEYLIGKTVDGTILQ
ncbi:MAG: UMP kinase [Patescibacteria group bacterium]